MNNCIGCVLEGTAYCEAVREGKKNLECPKSNQIPDEEKTDDNL